ncbi:hypothetical protein KIW84_UN0743 [Lathyrus oleraceus]|nr:hypothetical protein KIW84_UN0743 [Pisum sativum]
MIGLVGHTTTIYHGTPYQGLHFSTNHETKESSREANIHPAQYLSKGIGRRLQYVTPRQTCPHLMASGATCVQRLDGSRDSAIHTKYRISLRSSSMQEPRYRFPYGNLVTTSPSLNDKVQWTSHNVAGSEPPTSPQSEHFTDHSIGRSDGRCVQRQGRSQRADDSRLLGIPR